MDEKIGINIKEASEILGISKQLMAELTKLKDFPCIKFERRIVIRISNTNGNHKYIT